MDVRKRETLITRITSVGFCILALAVFKPFGLGEWQAMAYVHLLVIWVLGIAVCYIAESILKYLLKMPAAFDKGVDYIIHRNLVFQLINTPLAALMVCLYRHFVFSGKVEGNLFSIGNYLETLVIFAFCCFAIGLYWRFKYRSRYLSAELEEERQLNEQLTTSQRHQVSSQAAGSITLAGTTSETVTISPESLIYIESVGNYVKVYQMTCGEVECKMIRSTMSQVEKDLQTWPGVIRCHRAFLVNLGQVDRIISKEGSIQLALRHCIETIPVSRSHASVVKAAIKDNV